MLSIIRPLNLLYMVLIMVLLRYCIVTPLFSLTEYSLSLATWQYALLVLSVVLVAAGGYIINDYYDVAVDTLNKPDKLVIGNIISPQQALQAYAVCNVLGIGIAFYLATVVGSYRLAFVQIITATALWYYAAKWQKMPLIGNIVIALLASLLVLTPAFYEYALYNRLLSDLLLFIGLTPSVIAQLGIQNSDFSGSVLNYFYSYAFFAFWLTLARELVKDTEDMHGDADGNYRTLPIVAGIQVTKLLIVVTLMIVINYLVKFTIAEFAYQQYISGVGMALLAVLPCCIAVYLLWKARLSEQFGRISHLIKGVMFAGLLYMPYLYSTMSIGMDFTSPDGETITNIQFDPAPADTDTSQVTIEPTP